MNENEEEIEEAWQSPASWQAERKAAQALVAARFDVERAWFVCPQRVVPGDPIPGSMDGGGDRFNGVEGHIVHLTRGPFPDVDKAVEVAESWREEGKRSPLWLILVERNHITHCNKYQETP